MKNRIIKATLIVVAAMIVTMAIIDYQRVVHDRFPIFAIKLTKDESPKEIWVGPFYQSIRVTKYNSYEKLSDSQSVTFGPWFFSKAVKYKYSNIDKAIKFIPVLVLNCEKEKTFYFSQGNTEYYKVCLDNLSVSYQGKTKFLEQSIIKDNLSLRQIYDEATKVANPKGKYLLYQYPNFNLVKCETIFKDGKNINEIILTSKDVDHSTVCATEACTFTKTFKVVFLKKSMESEINHITLEQNNSGRFTTVPILQEYILDIEEGKNYNFSFVNPSAKNIDNHNVEEIFEYLDIIKIEEAKDGEFINENVCI